MQLEVGHCVFDHGAAVYRIRKLTPKRVYVALLWALAWDASNSPPLDADALPNGRASFFPRSYCGFVAYAPARHSGYADFLQHQTQVQQAFKREENRLWLGLLEQAGYPAVHQVVL